MTKKLIVWVPLPPGSSWRGEGIAQTVEHILVNFDPLFKCDILVSKHHHQDVVEAFKNNNNIIFG